MTGHEDLDTYNGDTEHDMWVDYENFENTGSSMFSIGIIAINLEVSYKKW